MNEHCFYDEDVSARPTSQINRIKKTSKLVGINHVRTEDRRWLHSHGGAILFYINYYVGVDFQAALFHRLAKVITGTDLKNDLGGDIMRNKTDRKLEG